MAQLRRLPHSERLRLFVCVGRAILAAYVLLATDAAELIGDDVAVAFTAASKQPDSPTHAGEFLWIDDSGQKHRKLAPTREKQLYAQAQHVDAQAATPAEMVPAVTPLVGQDNALNTEERDSGEDKSTGEVLPDRTPVGAAGAKQRKAAQNAAAEAPVVAEAIDVDTDATEAHLHPAFRYTNLKKGVTALRDFISNQWNPHLNHLRARAQTAVDKAEEYQPMVTRLDQGYSKFTRDSEGTFRKMQEVEHGRLARVVAELRPGGKVVGTTASSEPQ